ncbi:MULTISPECIES: preprotein translocase subunit YajC [Dyadobacter]|jgi:preprotein translocase subunit YajC|uniref:Sec translocon accessory complex subunit YajC n=1 Tax=Dyadobacter chenhuakuii TaxID=2909339 RepID=A0A9X1QEW6_9BACT|nr:MULTISPECIES: preprotein translocase subunit YajC [Dyadobacter]MCE7069806.1 preprotein translocase subunit YajC [Dyadobacter sp. CY327]MCF2492129.1 preprotein translocase subunit YajC [Dyadobacter chenhuakuii]MCF2498514.1 preprotein translocase subunit YajC [Dyadobacter chenhuakuii]MCF2516770.1 preprotein translocase subunit YajC [Dyadobacter sp. CY351]USJ28713.1 preprotein translocase subunit YajC [Dyadobacter chenhuakuii]
MKFSILAQAASGGSEAMIYQVVMWVGIIGVFYFFMIRPQQKKQKEQKELLGNLKKGDQVVTIGGIHARVYTVEDAIVTLELDKGVKLTVDKSAVARTIAG